MIFDNASKEIPRRWPIVPIVLVVIGIIGLVFLGWFISQPAFGQKIDAPPSVESAIADSLLKEHGRTIKEMKVYYCSYWYDLDIRYGAEIQLEYSRLPGKEGLEKFLVQVGSTYQKVLVVQEDTAWKVRSFPSFENNGVKFPMAPCKLGILGD
jgi:uncharacterized protein YneF (UPF0154 family)